MKVNQLSGKVAQTPEGKVINDLYSQQTPIRANSPKGQRGKWEDNK